MGLGMEKMFALAHPDLGVDEGLAEHGVSERAIIGGDLEPEGLAGERVLGEGGESCEREVGKGSGLVEALLVELAGAVDIDGPSGEPLGSLLFAESEGDGFFGEDAKEDLAGLRDFVEAHSRFSGGRVFRDFPVLGDYLAKAWGGARVRWRKDGIMG